MKASSESSAQVQSGRFPIAALLCLAATGFLAIMTETLPAGLLPELSAGLHVSNAAVGQLVSIYAVGSLLSAIPLTAATRGWNRRRVLMVCLAGLLLANACTAVSASYVLTLVARFVAGMCAGLVWGVLPGYAQQMVDERQQGRAIAMAMAGTPLAFSFGVPLGTTLAHSFGWRMTFGYLAVLAALVALYALYRVPDFAGVPRQEAGALRQALKPAGVRIVLAVVFLWMCAHNTLYTYVIPLIQPSHLAAKISTVLFLFGICAVAGILVTGFLVDRALRPLTLGSLVFFLAVCVGFGVARSSVPAVWLLCGAWGATFGGAATLLQTACLKAAGSAADLTPSLVTTSWNLAIAAGGFCGGGLIHFFGPGSLAWFSTVLVVIAFALAIRRAAFPAQLSFERRTS